MWGGNRTYFPIKAFFLNCYVLLREFQLKRLRSVKSNTPDLNHLLTSPAKNLTYMLIVHSSFLEIRKQFAAERRWFPMTFLVMVGHSLSCSLTVKTSFFKIRELSTYTIKMMVCSTTIQIVLLISLLPKVRILNFSL